MNTNNEELIQELVNSGVLKTPAIIEAFEKVNRADFVRLEDKSSAYQNSPLPIGEGQTISQPFTVAFMLERLQPQSGEKVLDIGAGSGWTSALLAELVGKIGQVVAFEIQPSICRFGKENLEKYQLISQNRVNYFCTDGSKNLPHDGQFDKILASAATKEKIPGAWRKALRVGGRIVAPIAYSVWLFVKKSNADWEETEFPGFTFVPLVISD